MIFRVFLLIVLLLLVFWALNSVAGKFTLTRQQSRLMIIVGGVLTTIVVLIVIGRLPVQFIFAPIGVAATFLLRMLPTALRLLPLWQMLKSKAHMGGGRSGKSGNQASVIRTEYLAMELKHSTGDMDGAVLKGKFEGKRLSQLIISQLLELATECGSDQDSLQVLEAYLDRMHPEWREQTRQQDQQPGHTVDLAMNRELALEVLGLEANVTREEIIKAHRKLMQKMHPDRGGSDYLAKTINAAKDYLLEHP